LEEASSGKEVIIARGSEPVAKLVPIGGSRSKRQPGKFAGLITYTEDAFKPLTERELQDLGFEK